MFHRLILFLLFLLSPVTAFAQASYFSLTPAPNPTIVTNSTTPPCSSQTTYNFNVVATPGINETGSAFSLPVTVTCNPSSTITISGVGFSNGYSFTAPATAGSTIDTLTAQCSSGSCAGATLSLSTSSNAPGCASVANNGDFAISGSNLNINSGVGGGQLGAGTYTIGIQVTLAGATNTGACYPYTVTGNTVTTSAEPEYAPGCQFGSSGSTAYTSVSCTLATMPAGTTNLALNVSYYLSQANNVTSVTVTNGTCAAPANGFLALSGSYSTNDYYCTLSGNVSGQALTVNFNASVQYIGLKVDYVLNSSGLDTSAITTIASGATTASSNAFTTTKTDLIWGVYVSGSGSAYSATAGTGFALGQSDSSNDTYTEWSVLGAGSNTATFALSPAAPGGTIVGAMAFLPIGAGETCTSPCPSAIALYSAPRVLDNVASSTVLTAVPIVTNTGATFAGTFAVSDPNTTGPGPSGTVIKASSYNLEAAGTYTSAYNGSYYNIQQCATGGGLTVCTPLVATLITPPAPASLATSSATVSDQDLANATIYSQFTISTSDGSNFYSPNTMPASTTSCSVTDPNNLVQLLSPCGMQTKVAYSSSNIGTYSNITVGITENGSSITPSFTLNITAGPAVPAEANLAGFTTLAMDSDFSQAAYANPSTNWLDWSNNTPSDLWHNGAPGFLSATGITSSDFYQTTDPSGTPSYPVLDIYYPGLSGGSTYDVASMQTVMNGCGGGGGVTGGGAQCTGVEYPHGMYVEAVYRIDNTNGVVSNGIGPIGVWNWQDMQGGGGWPLELDYGELYGDQNDAGGFGDAGWHNWGANTGNFLGWVSYGTNNLPSGWSAKTYHKYGVLETSDGSSNVTACSFVDDILQGCANIGALSNQYIGRNYLVAWNGDTIAQSNANVNMYLQYVHVWSCGNWNGASSPANECNGTIQVNTTQNGETLTYWH